MIALFAEDKLFYSEDTITPIAVGALGTSIPILVIPFFIIVDDTKLLTANAISAIAVGNLGLMLEPSTMPVLDLLISNKFYTSNAINPITVASLGTSLNTVSQKKLCIVISSKTYLANAVDPIEVSGLGIPIAADTSSLLVLINDTSSYISHAVAKVPIDYLGTIIPATLTDGIIILTAGSLYFSNIFNTRSDDVLPVITTFTASPTSLSLTVPITLYASDNIGVVSYALSETTSYANAVWLTTRPTSYAFATSGSKHLYAWVKDAAGNISTMASISLMIDFSPPVITSFIIPQSTNVPTVAVSLVGSDDIGITQWAISDQNSVIGLQWSPTKPTSFTFKNVPIAVYTNGFIFAFAMDAAGRVSNSARAVTSIYIPDVTAPVVLEFILTSGSTFDVFIKLTAHDDVGITGYYISEYSTVLQVSDPRWTLTKPTKFTFLTEGKKTLYLQLKDGAGNKTLVHADVTIAHDDIPPVITNFVLSTVPDELVVTLDIAITEARGVTGYYLSEISTAPTSASDWATSKPTDYIFNNRGFKKLYLWVKDAVGNISTGVSGSCTLTTTLSGRERLEQHIGTGTISLDSIKAYIRDTDTAQGVGSISSDTVLKITAGVDLTANRVVVQINGVVSLASATNLDHINRVVGITKSATAVGTDATVQFRSYMDEPTWNWDLDKLIFLGQNGMLTQSIPVIGFSQQLATVISPTRILINIQEPIQLGD